MKFSQAHLNCVKSGNPGFEFRIAQSHATWLALGVVLGQHHERVKLTVSRMVLYVLKEEVFRDLSLWEIGLGIGYYMKQ
jgi:hypothetical protein